MQDYEQHLSDDELVRVADVEPGRKTKKAGAHLESCIRCRNRAAEFQSAIAWLAQAQRNRLNSELPSIAGPRATLRARISEIAVRDPGAFPRSWIPSGPLAGAFGVAALLMVVSVAGVLVSRHSGQQNEPAPTFSFYPGVLPNRDFTPGAVRPASLGQICASAREEVVKEVSPAKQQKVLEEYGIPAAQAKEYEVDYLITPGLGGDDDIRNLWPEPYHTAAWNAGVKDALEERLHELVCSHQLDLAVAQRAIATNWISAYQQYVRPSQPKGRIVGDSSPVANQRLALAVAAIVADRRCTAGHRRSSPGRLCFHDADIASNRVDAGQAKTRRFKKDLPLRLTSLTPASNS